MIWGPFALAVALGMIVAAGLYAAYLWPESEPLAEPPELRGKAAPGPAAAPASGESDPPS